MCAPARCSGIMQALLHARATVLRPEKLEFGAFEGMELIYNKDISIKRSWSHIAYDPNPFPFLSQVTEGGWVWMPTTHIVLHLLTTFAAPRLPSPHFCLELAFSVLAFAAPSSQLTQFTDDPAPCTLVGDADIYGIGVRLSYYLAWCSLLLAAASRNPSAAYNATKGSTIISFAVLIAAIKNAMDGSLAVFEWNILYLIVTLPLTTQVLIAGSRVDTERDMAMLPFVFFGGVLPWLWFPLAEQGRRTDCELRGFVFVYYDFYHPSFVRFAKVWSILVTCGSILVLLQALNYILPKILPARLTQLPPFVSVTGILESRKRVLIAWRAPDTDLEQSIADTIVSLGCGTILIVFIENLLSGNQVQFLDSPIASTSQLIPFFVGIFTFVSTIWTVFKDWQDKRRKVNESGVEAAEVGRAPLGQDSLLLGPKEIPRETQDDQNCHPKS
ncbi:hypothetical protein B0H67DRAFT_609602 [Lasiosphaeris hirsuta]|uniref:Uncharacterized protein n=1 Tax=Lasiosphaeris hirsuta TaxID=260670 RepID=A0AA40AEP4_9PEZI|nr:hypothetical protein B0H67DRAFT_609602 [Lasiosphaeris hirsuta]